MKRWEMIKKQWWNLTLVINCEKPSEYGLHIHHYLVSFVQYIYHVCSYCAEDSETAPTATVVTVKWFQTTAHCVL